MSRQPALAGAPPADGAAAGPPAVRHGRQGTRGNRGAPGGRPPARGGHPPGLPGISDGVRASPRRRRGPAPRTAPGRRSRPAHSWGGGDQPAGQRHRPLRAPRGRPGPEPRGDGGRRVATRVPVEQPGQPLAVAGKAREGGAQGRISRLVARARRRGDRLRGWGGRPTGRTNGGPPGCAPARPAPPGARWQRPPPRGRPAGYSTPGATPAPRAPAGETTRARVRSHGDSLQFLGNSARTALCDRARGALAAGRRAPGRHEAQEHGVCAAVFASLEGSEARTGQTVPAAKPSSRPQRGGGT